MLSTSTLLSVALALGGVSGQALYGQCGGQGWTGGSSCPSGSSCSYQNPYYSQCLPGNGSSNPSGTASPPTTSVGQSATGAPPSSSIASNPATPDTPASTLQTSVKPGATTSAGGLKVKYAGVNIAGCDFGCDTSGNCNTGSAQCPSSVGPTQMQHFVKDDGLNAFRLPVGWQSLVNNQLGGTLDPTFFKTYDNIVQSCLSTGASCIVDIHNYARWNGGIIGQGGPSDDQFVSLWKQLATKYQGSSKVIFGVMNEPHDLDMSVWAQTVQKVVTAIRQAGASSQVILLPGTGYTSAGAFPSQSGPALSGVKNPDGSTTNLVFDVHQYYDSDHSGTNTECATDAISDSWSPLANYLRQNKRQALVSETGGGNTASCEQKVCAALSFIAQNSDVYMGWTGWAAGSFASSYELSEVPNGSQDTPLVTQCIVGKAK